MHNSQFPISNFQFPISNPYCPMPDDYLVFSLKYRPQTFDEIKCQDPVRETLKKAILNNRVAHAYLFCGPRGVGKTTTARILAKALNCEKGPTVTPDGTCASCREIAASRSMDVIEIDGASNRQIDDIRDLRENIKYAPSAGRYKIYIIDEVHMLTEFAFNALLKTLEEPPRHAKFIFATTAPHKVPSTILSRCQRFDFRKATIEELADLLRGIARPEKMKVDDDALYAIARRADGSIRDSETILDQLHAFRPEGISLQDVEQLLGVVPSDTLYRFVDLLKAGSPAELLTFVNDIFDRGYDLIELVTGLAGHVRALLALRLGIARETLGFSATDLVRLDQQAAKFTARELNTIQDTIVSYEESLKFTLMPRVLLEVMALKLATVTQPTAGIETTARPEPVATPARTSAPAAGRPAHASRDEKGSRGQKLKSSKETPEPSSPGTQEPSNRGAPEPSNSGTPEPLNSGTPEPLNSGTPEPLNSVTPEPLSSRTLEPLNSGTPEPLSSGTLEPLSSGTLEPLSSGAFEPSLATPAAGMSRSVWDTALTRLHQSRPLLAGVLSTVTVIDMNADTIRLTPPSAPMWDEKELAAELKEVERTLSQLANRPVKIVTVAGDVAKGNAGKSKKPSAIDKIKAVYDCEEL
jgi:DNA polymerase-3 subunit gamma/tau